MLDRRASFEVYKPFLSVDMNDILLVSAVIQLDLLTLKLVRIIARGIRNLL